MPTASDLVTDLPADFETFGQAVATSMADLLGGTTGQVLSKASNTNMDFTWVTTDDANAIQNSIVDAKGDIVAASANDTPARLAVGNNGETLVADSSTSTGLRYQSAYNGNAIINGGLDVWQRGTSIAVGAAIAYTADRWQVYRQGVVTGATVSRQSSSLTGIQYCARVQRDSGNTSTASINFNYQLESADSYRFANTPVTMSFYARAGANFSPTSGNLVFGMRSGTGTDQTQVGGFTGSATVGSGTAALTTTWQRFTVTGTPGSTTTQMGLYFYCDPTGTAGANDYFEITGVQLEQGSVATAFKRSNGAGGTIQGELSACMRYYWRNTSGETLAAMSASMPAGSTTEVDHPVVFPVPMRVRPTSLDAGSLSTTDGTTNYTSGTYALIGSRSGTYFATVRYTHGSAALTQYRPYQIIANSSATAFIGFSAEL
jgi:hypothetical protein